jgi:hypothetical protein
MMPMTPRATASVTPFLPGKSSAESDTLLGASAFLATAMAVST